MKAIVATKYGAPNVLQLKELAKPTPKDDEILIKIHATSVTSGDTRMRSFSVPASMKPIMYLVVGFTKPRNPVLGAELSGEVVAVGKDVTRFKTGEQVYALTGFGAGGYAEYKAMSEKGTVAIKPSTMSFQEAAALSFGGTTALHFLRRANIQRGQKVLVYGASGCVGTYSVQLAKYYGAEVTGVCSTANLEMVKALGADHVIDYTKDDFTKNAECYDIIMDTVGKTTFSQCEGSLAVDGQYLLVNGGLLDMLRPLWNKRFVSEVAGEKAEDLDFLRGLVEAGHIKAVIDRRYPLEQIADAHAYVDTGRKKGNVVIEVIAKKA